MESVEGVGGVATDATAAQSPRVVERDEKSEEDTVHGGCMPLAADRSVNRRNASADGEHRELVQDKAEVGDEDEEEVLVVLELCDFKNHPVFDDYEGLTLEGLDSASPTLKIGEFTLHGQLEETVGTSFFYDTTERTPSGEYRFAGQTVRKIKFTIEPPEQPLC